MLKIGLAGGSGSGKGIVSSLFSLSGIPAIDCDAVYHDMISRDTTLTRELAAAFGEEILSRDGGVDRRVLFDVAFRDFERRNRLNEISHRRIRAVLHEWMDRAEKQGIPAILVDAPLLFESGFDRECDLSIAVTAPYELRVERIMQRDGITRPRAEARIAAQISDEELARRADLVLQNDGDLAHFMKEIIRVLNTINKRGKEK